MTYTSKPTSQPQLFEESLQVKEQESGMQSAVLLKCYNKVYSLQLIHHPFIRKNMSTEQQLTLHSSQGTLPVVTTSLHTTGAKGLRIRVNKVNIN